MLYGKTSEWCLLNKYFIYIEQDLKCNSHSVCCSSVEQSIPSPGPDQPTQPGIINLLQLEKPIQRNHADLIKPSELRGDPSDKAQARKLRKKASALQDSAVVSINMM